MPPGRLQSVQPAGLKTYRLIPTTGAARERMPPTH